MALTRFGIGCRWPCTPPAPSPIDPRCRGAMSRHTPSGTPSPCTSSSPVTTSP